MVHCDRWAFGGVVRLDGMDMNRENEDLFTRELEKLLRECNENVPDTQGILHDLIALLFTKQTMEKQGE